MRSKLARASSPAFSCLVALGLGACGGAAKSNHDNPPGSGSADDGGAVGGGGAVAGPDGSSQPDGGPATALCSPADPFGPSGSYQPPVTQVACGTRQAYLWPFAKNSIWNMPIGDKAQYVDANLGPLGLCNVDNDLVYQENGADPSHDVIRWDMKYGIDGKGDTGKALHLPDAFVYPGGPNNGGGFVDPDGHTEYEFSAFQRDAGGANPKAWDYGPNDIVTGQGITGGHAGAGMAVLGGTLRPGELTGNAPIRHALKIELDWVVLSADWPGKYRWPAKNSDGYGNNTYGGKVKALTMGSLLAIRPDVHLDGIPWKTPLGKKIAKALQDYGGYVVDTTSSNGWMPNGGLTMAVCAQNEAIDEVKSTYQIDFRSGWGGGGPDWTADMAEIYKRLAVVDNNTETSIGGGGTPRAPLAPDFAH